jgi:hypothetical protein
MNTEENVSFSLMITGNVSPILILPFKRIPMQDTCTIFAGLVIITLARIMKHVKTLKQGDS